VREKPKAPVSDAPVSDALVSAAPQLDAPREMLRLDGVTKMFDGFRAVGGASLRVDAGSIVAVIGPNGAGKTTTFNLITGLLRPDGGEILFEGLDIGGLAPHEICRRGIGRTFQIANVFPRLSVFANVHVSVLARLGRSFSLLTRAARVGVDDTRAILEQTGLTALASRPAGTLSHGDLRILELAVALGSRPRLLVLDEPTAGMSPEDTASTIALITRLGREHALTILFCEHDMDVVFSVADSIMVMRGGRTIIQGSPDVVRRHPEVQAAYLGSADA
jgi:branched-chain amino acid transport system ATP-binding protein